MEKHFQLLGLTRTAATEEAVKRAYRKKALLVHPDRNPQSDGEAFKALQDAYETALADVRRRPAQRGTGRGSSVNVDIDDNDLWGRDPYTGTDFYFTKAAGAAYSYARANAAAAAAARDGARAAPRTTTTTTAPPPLFSEEELFGDAVPGGWRDVGSQQRPTKPTDSHGTNHINHSHNANTTSSSANATTASAATADARWRSAHGSRVPLSAYESAGPVPPPPRADHTAPTHPPRRPPASPPSSPHAHPAAHKEAATAAAAAAGASTAAAGAQGSHRRRPLPPQPSSSSSSTQAQWDAFMAQDHAWRRPSSSSPPPPTRDPAHSSSEDESAEDRAFREALYLHRRAQELYKRQQRESAEPVPTSHPPQPGARGGAAGGGGGSSSAEASATLPFTTNGSTSQADKEALYQQWDGIQSSLHRKMHTDDAHKQPPSQAAQSRGRSGGEERTSASAPAATTSSSSSSNAPPAFTFGPSPRETNLHQEAIVNERRALQREYLRFRYTPDPADVGNMSDMEVYLLAELLGDIHTKVKAVLQARLTKGMCTVCHKMPRSMTCQYFACGHRSVCAVCHAAGVRSCPLCGARRLVADPSDDESDA